MLRLGSVTYLPTLFISTVDEPSALDTLFGHFAQAILDCKYGDLRVAAKRDDWVFRFRLVDDTTKLVFELGLCFPILEETLYFSTLVRDDSAEALGASVHMLTHTKLGSTRSWSGLEADRQFKRMEGVLSAEEAAPAGFNFTPN